MLRTCVRGAANLCRASISGPTFKDEFTKEHEASYGASPVVSRYNPRWDMCSSIPDVLILDGSASRA